MIGRIIRFALIGGVVGLAQWMLFQIFPITNVIRFDIILITIAVLRLSPAPAISFALGTQLIIDLFSPWVFPFYIAITLSIIGVMLISFKGFFSHRGKLSFMVAGATLLLVYRGAEIIFMKIIDGIPIALTASTFPALQSQLIWTLGVLLVVIYIRERKWNVIYVDSQTYG